MKLDDLIFIWSRCDPGLNWSSVLPPHSRRLWPRLQNNEAPCHNGRGKMDISLCSKTMGAEPNPRFCSSSLVRMMWCQVNLECCIGRENLEIHMLMFTNMQYFLLKIQRVATPIPPPTHRSASVWLSLSQTPYCLFIYTRTDLIFYIFIAESKCKVINTIYFVYVFISFLMILSISSAGHHFTANGK